MLYNHAFIICEIHINYNHKIIDFLCSSITFLYEIAKKIFCNKGIPLPHHQLYNILSRPFLVALMHFNPANKLVENGGGEVGKGGMAFRQLQKLLRPSSRVLVSG